MNDRFDSHWRIALHAAALLGLLAACGGGDDGGMPAAPPPGPVTFTQPAAFASGLSGVVTVQATSSDAATTGIEFQIDGTALAVDTSAPYGTTVDSDAFASGQHVLRARAIDAAGQPSAWTPLTVQFGGARTQPAGFARNEGFAVGLSEATAFTQLPDGRLLVAQQGGTLRVLQGNGTAIGTMLTVAVDSQGERGLLGVTPHPDFASNGFIYIYYTTTQDGTHNRISRFTVSGNTAGSEVQIANLPALSSATNHNGGAIHFGVDGKLYVGVGENANGALAQNLNSPLGKLLRFNDDGSIPGDNPFCTTPGNLACAVWAYGLRNPFTFAVQPGDRPHPHQRRRPEHLGRNQCRCTRRQLRLAVERRADRRQRHHRTAVRLRPQQHARQHRRLLQRLRDRRRCVLSRRRAVSASLPRQLLLHRPVQSGDRPHRPGQRQRRLCVRQACRAPRSTCWSPTTARCWC